MTLNKIALVAALFASQAAFAAEWPDNAAYVGIGAGQSKLKGDIADSLQEVNRVPGASFDDKDTTGKVFVGKQFNKNFAVEASYAYLGKYSMHAEGLVPGYGASTAGVNASGRSLGLDAVVTLPLTKKLDVLGRVGVARTRVDSDAHVSLGNRYIATASDRAYSTDPKVGLGLQYKFTEKVALRGEFERTRLKFEDSKNYVNSVSASLVYKFGRPAFTKARVVETKTTYAAPAPVAAAPVVQAPAPAVVQEPTVVTKKVRE